MKKLLSVVLAFLMGLALVGCSSSSSSDDSSSKDTTNDYNLVTEGKLTVAMSTDFAPMEFVDLTKSGQEKYVGSDVELAKFIADKLGLELEIKAMDFDACQTAVSSKIVDISISGYSYTTERAASYLLSEDYFAEGDSGQVAVITAANKDVYKDLASLNVAGVDVAAQNGALQQEIVEEQLPNATLKAIDDLNSAYDSLKAGTYAAVVVAKSVAETLVASDASFAIVEEQFDDSKYTGYHALIEKSNTALCDAVNAAIKELSDGQYAKWQEDAEALFLSLGDNAAEDIIPEKE